MFKAPLTRASGTGAQRGREVDLGQSSVVKGDFEKEVSTRAVGNVLELLNLGSLNKVAFRRDREFLEVARSYFK